MYLYLECCYLFSSCLRIKISNRYIIVFLYIRLILVCVVCIRLIRCGLVLMRCGFVLMRYRFVFNRIIDSFLQFLSFKIILFSDSFKSSQVFLVKTGLLKIINIKLSLTVSTSRNTQDTFRWVVHTVEAKKKLYVQNFNYCKSTVESTVAKKCGVVNVRLRE